MANSKLWIVSPKGRPEDPQIIAVTNGLAGREKFDADYPETDFDRIETPRTNRLKDMRVRNGEIVIAPVTPIERMEARRRASPGLVGDVAQMVLLMQALASAGMTPADPK